MQELQTTLPNGTIVHARYVVEDMLGKGGFGAVYLVRDRRVENNRFALKEIVDPDARTRKNFIVECELLRRLDHPALPRFYSIFDDDPHERIYLLMDYVAGQNLDLLRQRQHKKRFSLKQALRLMGPVMDAVSYLHQCEPPIIHRDIKPANIIVSASKDDTVLVDFGIAKEYDQDATTTAVRRLSPHYSAPEQYTFGTNLSTDIYGLGATLYVMLSGVVPVDAFHRVIQLRTKGIEPLEPLERLLPHLAPAVSAAIERAMAIRAEDRFASVQEFWQALQSIAADVKTELPLAAVVDGQTESSLTTSVSHMPTLEAPASGPEVVPVSGSDVAALDTSPATTALVEAHDDVPLETSTSANPALTPIPASFMASATPIPESFMATSLSSSTEASGYSDRARSRRLVPVILGIIALFALLAGLLYGTGIVPSKGGVLLGSGASQPSSSHQASGTAAATAHATVAETPTQVVRSSPTSSVHRQPTSAVPPFVTGSTYAGTAYDQSAKITGDLTFTQVQQTGNTFKGTLIFSNGLSGQANFNGTMDANKNFQFIVTPYTDHLPLLFQGKVNPNGTLSGNYCSESNNVCDDSSGGYGTWQLTSQ